ncbi:MAG: PH domain-containing protein [Thaumarchaeota archaeon]|nr:PH domain-containing protein [Nitrososphaerota archaeon]
MEGDKDVVWSGRPWIGPSVAARTIGAALAVVVVFVGVSALGLAGLPILGIPLFVLAAVILAIAWLASIAGLVVMRASYRYVLRHSSVEVDRGIVSRRSLIVSPSAFAELEVDQGVMGRMMNYGSLEVRSQGGQQLNLWLIRDPKGVSTRIREVMTVPTVRVAGDDGAGAPGPS